MTAVTAKVTNRQVVVRLEITGADARRVPHSREGRSYLPDVLELEYYTVGDAWSCYVVIHGQVLKKDGTVGVHRPEEPLYSRDKYPDWVQYLVDYHRPPAVGVS